MTSPQGMHGKNFLMLGYSTQRALSVPLAPKEKGALTLGSLERVLWTTQKLLHYAAALNATPTSLCHSYPHSPARHPRKWEMKQPFGGAHLSDLPFFPRGGTGGEGLAETSEHNLGRVVISSPFLSVCSSDVLLYSLGAVSF